MGRKYYTLLALENINGVDTWCIDFGDYDKECVKQEKYEYEHNRTKIICTNDDQASIDAKVKELNAK